MGICREFENVLLDALTQQEGRGYSESRHEFDDIPWLMAWAWSHFWSCNLKDHLFAVENSEHPGRCGDVRHNRDHREKHGPRTTPAAQPLNKHREFFQIEVIENIPNEDDVEDRFITERKQFGKGCLLPLLLRFCCYFPFLVTAIEVLDMKLAGELRPESHIVFESWAEVQDRVSVILLQLVE